LPEPLLPAGSLDELNLDLFDQQGILGNLSELQEAAQSAGYFDNPSVDADGIFRKFPLVQTYQGAMYEALPLAMVRSLFGMPVLELRFGEDKGVTYLEALLVAGQTIPVDEKGRVFIPYRGAYQSFPYVSAVDVINRSIDKSLLENAIVLVGSTAPGLMDLRATPVQRVYPGVEVHANLIAGLLDGNMRFQPDYTAGIEFVGLLVLGVVMSLLYSRLPLFGMLLISSFLVIAVVGFNLAAWRQQMVLPVVSPLLLVLVLQLYQLAYGFFVEARAKRILGTRFGHYVPPEIVKEMSERGGDFALRGESRHMSVLFSDVRDFTTLSESLDPQELTRLMNDFLTPITEVIHDNRGTIDKYMGDAVMAFWGAPLKDEEHARHAVDAALAMSNAMHQLRRQFRDRGWPEIRIGIGINSGEMSVGNMGSRFRMAYTVLGDEVNLGSRLEGLTKYYGVDIIISDSTRAAVPNLVCRELDRVRVKGKSLSRTIYEPLGYEGGVEQDVLARLDTYQEALEAYRARQWDRAESLFEQLFADNERQLYRTYLRRISRYRQEPPGEGWDATMDFSRR
jgi:adenylate cyclase